MGNFRKNNGRSGNQGRFLKLPVNHSKFTYEITFQIHLFERRVQRYEYFSMYYAGSEKKSKREIFVVLLSRSMVKSQVPREAGTSLSIGSPPP